MAVSNATSNSTVNTGRDTTLITCNHFGSPVHDPLAVLRGLAALGAQHDSADRPDPPKCHPETRKSILNFIDQWARDRSDTAKSTLWLTGAAGAGKTAIAQTMVERWKKEELIVPNFFFLHSSLNGNQKTYLISSLAFQLAVSCPRTKAKIEKAIKDETIFERSSITQVEELISSPLQDVLAHDSEQIVVVVIDGLDQLRVDLPEQNGFPGQAHEDQQREILQAIASACQRLPHLRILIASRPERQIRTSFAEEPLRALSLQVSLINEPDAAADIGLYLRLEFAEIRGRHPEIDSSWPSEDQISLLVAKASGQFIYPSTVIKYISQGRRFPVKGLEDVLAIKPRVHRRQHPLAELDALYTFVLKSVNPESWPLVRLVIALMCCTDILSILPILDGDYPSLRPSFLENLLLLSRGELSSHLTDLHSIIGSSSQVRPSTFREGLVGGPHPDYSRENRELCFMHATLREYLTDHSRSEDLSISENDAALLCSLALLKHQHAEPPRSPHDSDEIYIAAAACAALTKPSSELMRELWDLLKDDLGDYPCSDRPYNSQQHKHRKRKGRSPHTYHHPSFTGGKLKILQYLMSCNIPEIEPSISHRDEIKRRLDRDISRIAPETADKSEHDSILKAISTRCKRLLRG